MEVGDDAFGRLSLSYESPFGLDELFTFPFTPKSQAQVEAYGFSDPNLANKSSFLLEARILPAFNLDR